ncbi:unnamed protein product [Prorocentrum cordatum]|uniref:Endonuclease/exonuclease/phosphatase domain-containing protein n=1 Tax=Prorocentrum cordatum TaxID=2364126 RepID=A0ABN9VVS3_9DINO|nr:unnamed protein product [Polarella glacialis]
MGRVTQQAARDLQRAAQSTTRHSLWMHGDFNFLAPGESALRLDDPARGPLDGARRRDGARPRLPHGDVDLPRLGLDPPPQDGDDAHAGLGPCPSPSPPLSAAAAGVPPSSGEAATHGGDETTSEPSRRRLQLHQRAWQDILDQVTAVAEDKHTHYWQPNSKLSRIDRAYTSLPGWYILQVRLQMHVRDDPQLTHRKLLSDHAPIITLSSDKQHIPTDLQPIPKAIAKSRNFQDALQELVQAVPLDELDTVTRWDTHKRMIREAGRIARTELMADPTALRSKPIQLLLLSSMARAVARQDHYMAKKLVAMHDIAKKHIHIVQGKVTGLPNPTAFQELYASAKMADTSARKRAMDDRAVRPGAQNNSIKVQRNITRLNMLAKLWSPFGKRLKLAAIILDAEEAEDDGHIRGPDNIAMHLHNYWASTFTTQSTDTTRAANFLRKWTTPIPTGDFPEPTGNTMG